MDKQCGNNRRMNLNIILAISVICGASAVAMLSFVATSAYVNSGKNQLSDFESRVSGLSLLIKEILSPITAFIMRNQNSPSLTKPLSNYKHLLISAGSFYGLNVYEIYAIKLVLPVIFAIFATIIFLLFQLDINISLFTILFFAILLYFYPSAVLKQKAEHRRELFLKQLPGGLDILKIAADAGLDFHKSINYLVDIYIPGPIKEEFAIFQREIKLGISISDALVNIAHRIDMPDASTVFISVSQSVEMGISVSEMLANTIGDIRKKRLLSAETEAQKTTVKITFPLLFLILPGIFIVLLAPMAKPMIEAFAGF